MSAKLQLSRLLDLIQLPIVEFNPRIVAWIEDFEKIPKAEVNVLSVDELKNEIQIEATESLCKLIVDGYISGFTLHEHEKSMQIFTIVLQYFLQKSESLKDIEKLIFSVAFYGRIHQRIEMDDYPTALSECKLLCFVNEDFAVTYELRAYLHSSMHRDYEASLSDYQKVILYIPENAELYWNCGVMLENLERYDEAIVQYKKCLERNPKHTNALLAVVSLEEKNGKSKEEIQNLIQNYPLDNYDDESIQSALQLYL